jgi:hypothetical protein
MQNHTTQFFRPFRGAENADELLQKLLRGLNYKENGFINQGESRYRNGRMADCILGIEASGDPFHTLSIAAHIETSVRAP